MITKIVKSKNNSLKFQIKGDYDVCVINALRRITIANLSTFAFSRNSIVFQTNKTIYNEDFLSMRFSLLPLNSNILQLYKYTLIHFYSFNSFFNLHLLNN